jgi:hypothetical protein
MNQKFKKLIPEEDDYLNLFLGREDLEDLAKDSNCIVIYSEDNLLLLDLDNDESVKTFHRNIDTFRNNYSVKKINEWKSKSGNLHVAIEMNDNIDFRERLLLQATLGSDPKKELLSLIRHREGMESRICSVLFKPV